MDRSTVVRYHREDEFNKLSRIVRFIPGIRRSTELHILESWEQYFKSLNVPYAVTKVKEKKRTVWQIWKEDLIKDEPTIKYKIIKNPYRETPEGKAARQIYHEAYYKKNKEALKTKARNRYRKKAWSEDNP